MAAGASLAEPLGSMSMPAKGPHSNTLLVDLDSGQPMATFKGRRAEDVIAWFNSRPQAERDRVEGVVLDLSKTVFGAVKAVFGDQVHVIDRFHVVQQAVSALDEVLRSVQKQLDPEEAKELKAAQTLVEVC